MPGDAQRNVFGAALLVPSAGLGRRGCGGRDNLTKNFFAMQCHSIQWPSSLGIVLSPSLSESDAIRRNLAAHSSLSWFTGWPCSSMFSI